MIIAGFIIGLLLGVTAMTIIERRAISWVHAELDNVKARYEMAIEIEDRAKATIKDAAKIVTKAVERKMKERKQ